MLVKFPQEETGKMRKLSRPWHGPYRILTLDEPDVTAIKVYFPEDKTIRVHLSLVTPYPTEFPLGFYWYGTKRHSSGCPPKWLQCFLNQDSDTPTVSQDVENELDTTTVVDSPPAEHSVSVDETHSDIDEADLEPAMMDPPSN